MSEPKAAGRRRALFVGAHADDVEIGAGGTIQRLLADGWEIWIIVATGAAKVDIRRLRESEAIASALKLGVPQERVAFLRFEDTKLAQANGVPARIRQQCNDWFGTQKPGLDAVFTHSQRDAHQDHVACCTATRAAFRVPILHFSVFTSTTNEFQAHVRVCADITRFFPGKLEAFLCHRSQKDSLHGGQAPDSMKEYDARYRTATGFSYAEAFEVTLASSLNLSAIHPLLEFSDDLNTFRNKFLPNLKEDNPSWTLECFEELESHWRDRHPRAWSPSADRSRRLVGDLASSIIADEFSPLVKGIALRETGQLSLAIEKLEEAAQNEPDYPRNFSNLAHAYAENGDLDKAIRCLEEAIRIRQKEDGIEWPRYHFHIARYLLRRRRHSEDLAQAQDHLALALLAGPEWEQKIVADLATFGEVLDGALLVARRRQKQLAQSRDLTTAQVCREIEKVPKTLHAAIYGSYWLNGADRYRDIDVVVITDSKAGKAELRTARAEQMPDTPIHIYIVPNDMLQADITSLTYGQFYSYKFILGAEGVRNEPQTDSCVLGVVRQAIREASAGSYQTEGERFFQYRYSTQWFMATVFKQRIHRDPTFLRCLRRVFDHYSEKGLNHLSDIYGRALHGLRCAGELSGGPNREGFWSLCGDSVKSWTDLNSIPDEQVAGRFWQTYESFKQPKGRDAVLAKQKNAVIRSLSYRQDIENRIEDLRRKGRAPMNRAVPSIPGDMKG